MNNRLTTDGTSLTVLEALVLARLAINGLPRIAELSRLYGRFQEHLDDLEADLRSACGDVDAVLCPPRKRSTARRCSCS